MGKPYREIPGKRGRCYLYPSAQVGINKGSLSLILSIAEETRMTAPPSWAHTRTVNTHSKVGESRLESTIRIFKQYAVEPIKQLGHS